MIIKIIFKTLHNQKIRRHTNRIYRSNTKRNSYNGNTFLHWRYTFLDEAESINKYVNELSNKDIKSIVVIIHQGGSQNDKGEINGPISDIVKSLDDEVDIVLSAHSHTYINSIVKTIMGKSY